MRYSARFSFPARHERDPWRIIDCETNTAVWLSGGVARYEDEAAAQSAAVAMNARAAASSVEGRAKQSDIDNRRKTFVQMIVLAASAACAVVLVVGIAHELSAGYAHVQSVVRGVIP